MSDRLKEIRDEVKSKGWSRDLCNELLQMVAELQAQVDAVRLMAETEGAYLTGAGILKALQEKSHEQPYREINEFPRT